MLQACSKVGAVTALGSSWHSHKCCAASHLYQRSVSAPRALRQHNHTRYRRTGGQHVEASLQARSHASCRVASSIWVKSIGTTSWLTGRDLEERVQTTESAAFCQSVLASVNFLGTRACKGDETTNSDPICTGTLMASEVMTESPRPPNSNVCGLTTISVVAFRPQRHCAPRAVVTPVLQITQV